MVSITMHNLTANVERLLTVIPKHVVVGGGFDPAEFQALREYCEKLQTTDAGISSSGIVDETTRKCKTVFIHQTQETIWIFEKLFSLLHFVNSNFFDFDIKGFSHFQYTCYDSTGSHYDYHLDINFGIPSSEISLDRVPTRKLSVSLILSDPSEYTGGEFMIKEGKKEETIPQPQGAAICFPSFMQHKVCPIISGKRESIVVWAVGPRFR